jgi:hypothetical protein
LEGADKQGYWGGMTVDCAGNGADCWESLPEAETDDEIKRPTQVVGNLSQRSGLVVALSFRKLGSFRQNLHPLIYMPT